MAESERILSYRDLIVWQKGIDLVINIYELTLDFPSDERFGLVSQVRRSAVSISANIAEGYRRKTRGDYARFLRIAHGSTAELETLLLIAIRLGYLDETVSKTAFGITEEISKMLHRLIDKVSPAR